MINAELLERKVVASLRPRIGERLHSVTYRCIEHEAARSDLEDPDFYMGGELLLTFDGSPLFISWDENAGWKTAFSVQTSERSLFLHDARLESFDASAIPLWRRYIGSPLVAAQVLGWDEVPYAVVLVFERGALVVGSACESQLGDGDDLLFREQSYLEQLPRLDVLWRSPPAA